MAKQTITVFGSGTIAEASPSWRIAYDVGYQLAKAGFVVATGGYAGAQTAACKGARDAGGSTLGVTTDEFLGWTKNAYVDQEKRFPNWYERLCHLIAVGSGFVVLDGGTGTLVELLVSWEMLNKGIHTKPVAILGPYMQTAINALMVNPEVKLSKKIRFVVTPEAAVRYLTETLRL